MQPTTFRNTIFAASLNASLALTAVTAAQAQASPLGDSGLNSSLTLAPADASSSGGGGVGDDEAAKQAELVKKTLNPIASLISVPFQNNWDFGIGPTDAMRYTPLLKVGKQPLSLQLGYRYYADGPQGGPDWGLRFAITLLLPK